MFSAVSLVASAAIALHAHAQRVVALQAVATRRGAIGGVGHALADDNGGALHAFTPNDEGPVKWEIFGEDLR